MYTIAALSFMLSFWACSAERQTEYSDSWQYAINHPDSSLSSLYSPEVISLNADGMTIKGRSEVVVADKHQFRKILSVDTLFSIVATRDSSYTYEILELMGADSQRYRQLVIFDERSSSHLRELEFNVAFTEGATPDTIELNQRRQEWMNLCQAHNAAELVRNLYADDALYFNQNNKPRLIHGREALISEYDYMNRPEYQLTLTPLYISAVQQDLIYEIGQCSGSYGGKYILVWQHLPGHPWEILFDSNI
ncbi:MAG: hypothetical protein AAFQ68_20290 [Bacteroidota bacterium]